MIFFAKKPKQEEDIRQIKKMIDSKDYRDQKPEQFDKPFNFEETFPDNQSMEPEFLPDEHFVPQVEHVQEVCEPMPKEKPTQHGFKKEVISPKLELHKPLPVEHEEQSAAPLFVKIDKYRNVLGTITDLKTTTMMLKNSLALQKEIERAKEENLEVLEKAINKIESKIINLDAEFLRPNGYVEHFPTNTKMNTGLDGAVENLKCQIDDLKNELEDL